MKYGLTIVGLVMMITALAQGPGTYPAIYPGVPVLDDRGKTISAHGACIIEEKERYYLFGEIHSDTSNAFAGFSCYSSTDLRNWKFESVALSVQASGELSADRVGERPKVMKCPFTGEYIMYMHADSLGYKNQFVGYATSPVITGPYQFKGPLLFNGKPVKKWDMGAFQDKDGTGYILIHGGEIYRLNEDYKSITEQVSKSFVTGGESPAIFRKDNIYYWLGSHLTSWERNDNFYFTAMDIRGPWTNRGLIAPEGTLTWNSQTTFILPVQGNKGSTYMFMGDRWSFPKQHSAATYVWQPLTVEDGKISLPQFWESWSLNSRTGKATRVPVKGVEVPATDTQQFRYTGKWLMLASDSGTFRTADKKGAEMAMHLNGKQFFLYGMRSPIGGYARISLQDARGNVLINAVIDFYCKYPSRELVYASPLLKKGNYTLKLEVLGEHGTWSDKKKSNYGSTGDMVSLEKIVVN